MKLYLCGPMTGLPDFNYPHFNSVARTLRRLGHDVINPAELGTYNGEAANLANYMKRDIPELLDCDGVAVLLGWNTGRGTLIELFNAIMVNIPVYNAYDLEPLEIDLSDLLILLATRFITDEADS